jgi:hypothetical protein
MCPLCCFTVFFTCLYVLTQYICIVTTMYSTIFCDQRLCHSELVSYVVVEDYVTQFVDMSLSSVGMAFLQAGLRESRKTRSRSSYPWPLVRDNPEGRISSLSDWPNLIMEGQLDYAQHKFLASSMHSNVFFRLPWLRFSFGCVFKVRQSVCFRGKSVHLSILHNNVTNK